MQIVDAIILLTLGIGAVVGFKRGFFRQTVQSIGGIFVVILAFVFKHNLAVFLLKVLPAFNFKGIFNGISSLNILVYETIAFIILLIIFGIIFRIVVSLATLLEKFLNATIILAIPSKILGAVMGVIEYYLMIFVALFILTLPVFNIRLINESKYKDRILEGTPFVSSLAKKTVESFNDIYALKDELAKQADRLELDQKILNILLENKIISEKQAADLYSKGKIDTK